MQKEQDQILSEVTTGEYKYGFYTDIEHDSIGKGLNEDVIRMISEKKNEPEFMLQFVLRLTATGLQWKCPVGPIWKYLQ
jgi:Fe-S cluster assembly protein SufB